MRIGSTQRLRIDETTAKYQKRRSQRPISLDHTRQHYIARGGVRKPHHPPDQPI
jgi:hypothetical protein